MLGTRKLIVDTHSEISDLITAYTDAEFWDFASHDPVPGAVYIIGREQFRTNLARIRALVENNTVHVVLSNPHEGSDTLRQHVRLYGVEDLVLAHRIPIIGGGAMDSSWPCLHYDSFLPKLLDYTENQAAAGRAAEIYTKTHKPYKFLFLNGRSRAHRRELLQHWQNSGLLASALWTNLDSGSGPIHLLPAAYEYAAYKHNTDSAEGRSGYVKAELFANEWGEIYLNPAAYTDTYFSVVTETVFTYPYSFRTEKIWKPIVMGHPFVAVANCGYLQDLRDMGFRTYSDLIDESYDTIANDELRLQRVQRTVEHLCSSDLASFITAAADTSKYNQQLYADLRQQVRRNFPQRFEQFIQQYIP